MNMSERFQGMKGTKAMDAFFDLCVPSIVMAAMGSLLFVFIAMALAAIYAAVWLGLAIIRILGAP